MDNWWIERYALHMIFLLLVGDTIIILAHIFLRDKIGFFDIDKEGNLASLFSGAKLWFVATLAFIHALILSRLNISRRIVVPWILFALGMLYIGLDDMMGIHERIGFVLNNRLGMGGFKGESFNWLLYFSPFIVTALVVFGAIIIHIYKTYRRAVWLLIAGVLLWIGSIGTEIYGRQLIVQPNTPVPLYHKLIVAEEALELIGATLIAGAAWYTVQQITRRHIRIVEK